MIIALYNCVGFCQTSPGISCRYTYIPSLWSLPPISLPISALEVDTEPGLSPLSPTANSHFHLFYIQGCVFPCCSLQTPHPLFPHPPRPHHVQKSVLLCLHCCPANNFISTIFLDSIYVH